MAVVGTASRPTSYWWSESSPNQYAEKVTIPSNGNIVSLGQWMCGQDGTARTKLCVWSGSTGALLAQSAQFTAADGGSQSSSAMSLYVEALTAPLAVTAGQVVYVGLAHHPSDRILISGGRGTSDTHYTQNQASWPGSMTASPSSMSRRIGSYVADFEPGSPPPTTDNGVYIYRAGAWLQIA